jgi:hypothetical protein
MLGLFFRIEWMVIRQLRISDWKMGGGLLLSRRLGLVFYVGGGFILGVADGTIGGLWKIMESQ